MSEHASPKLYWLICAILCTITFLEWLVFKFENLRENANFMLPTLLLMSLVKFVLVCGWYMHLKYDHKWLKIVFVGGAFMAFMTMGIYMAVM